MKGIFRLLAILCLLTIISCSSNKNEQPKETTTPPPDTTHTTIETPYDQYTVVDVSPMDMTYFPADYPKLKMAKAITSPPLARIVYSRPHLQNRKLFQEVLKYGEPWRLGANESTELELFQHATVQGKRVNAGRYILYCIPQQDNWTIVFNSNIDSWGLHQDSTKDVMRFTIPALPTANHVEYFTMLFEGKGTEAELLMAWDGIEARLPFRF
ncbi:MAG TPA: DUF2911 domain-containing protein [Chitinophagaceae bacterium]